MRRLLFLVFSTSLIFAVIETANACSCGPRPAVLESFEEADEVVIVKAISVEKAEDNEDQHYVDGVKSTTMVVEKVFKGNLKVRDEIVFGQGGGADCIWTFDEESVGEQYLFYLARPEKLSTDPYLTRNRAGLWLAFGCGRSRGLDGATEDLLYLENLAKRRGKTRISGSIGGYANPDMDVEGKKIKFIGPKKTYQTKTDEDGVFEIYDLPPGKYFIEPEVPAGWKIDPYWFRRSPSVVGAETGEPEMKSPKQFAVMLEPKKHVSVDIVFTEDNSVRGRVVDSTGRAMEGACVHLLHRDENVSGGGGFNCTDEQGRFEINQVPKGEYVLVANPDGKPSSREPFPRIFYPSVMERERAAVISIAPGERIRNLDIIIPKLAETVKISGVLLYSDGMPVGEKWVKFKVSTPNEKVDGDATTETDKAGRFTLSILKGLKGELAAEEWLRTGLYKDCPKVDELIAQSGESSVTAYSNVIKLTAAEDMYAVELTMPFPKCEKAKE